MSLNAYTEHMNNHSIVKEVPMEDRYNVEC